MVHINAANVEQVVVAAPAGVGINDVDGAIDFNEEEVAKRLRAQVALVARDDVQRSDKEQIRAEVIAGVFRAFDQLDERVNFGEDVGLGWNVHRY